MQYFVFHMRQSFRLVFGFLFLSYLSAQGQSKIVHADIISEADKVEIKFIFDEIIDRDDVSGWIDRNNYFTLSLFNVSMSSREIFNKKFKYPLLSVETADTEGSVQIIFNTARTLDSYQLIRHSKGKNLLVILPKRS